MPIRPDAPFPKTQGDNLRSKDWNDAINELIRLDNDKVNRSGDKFTGPLSVTALGVGSNAPPDGIQVKSLTRINEGVSGAGAWANIGSNLSFDGGWKRVDNGKAGVNLHINADGQGQEFRFCRMEANGQNARNIATVGTNGMTLEAGNLSFGTRGDGTPSPTITTTGRMHITGGELCYLLHKSGVIVGKEWGGNGNLTVEGSVTLGNSDIYFTDPNHTHTGIGNTAGHAAIENGANFKALMILGRAGGAHGRTVHIYDYLEIHPTGGAVLKFGEPKSPYGAGDAIRGEPNLWLDASGKVLIKKGVDLNAGLDIAERFPATGEIEAGDVVVFDAETNGVKVCDQAADGRVVGIASAEAALTLGMEETHIPIALCGRLPCKVDADAAPVQVGDLLMTSPTKGHAQKVMDVGRSAGKILGKALAPLLKGKGEIPVLVFLH